MISVIVPVYRVEQYLPACINSILAQTYTDFELILVDDGSPDNCGAICDSYAARDPRIRVIHQENMGLSGARNSGMDAAKGEYITFIDSDDLVTVDCFQVFLDAILQYNADVSCIRLEEIEESACLLDLRKTSTGTHQAKVFSGQDAAMNIYSGEGDIGITACGKLAKKDLFERFHFPVGQIHEDQAVIPIVLCESKKVVAVDSKCYCYRKRANSIMQSSFSAKRLDNLKGLETCINYFTVHGYYELAVAAKRTKKKVNAMLVILADCNHCRESIPKEYRMTRLRALYLCHKYLSDDKYSWYLAQIHPKGVAIHYQLVRIKKILLGA